MRHLLLPALSLLVLSGCGHHASVCPKPAPTADTTPTASNTDAPACCCEAVTPTQTLPDISGGYPGSKKPAQPVAVKADGEESSVRFPEDAGGALLLKTLQPQVSASAILERTLTPRAKPGPARVETPSGLPTASLDDVPRLPAYRKPGNLTPRITLTESLGSAGPVPAVPTSVTLPELPKVKAERLDPTVAPDLPVLGQPVPDRAPLDDATRALSFEAVIAATIPERQTPAPFVAQTIPDPFVNRKVVQVAMPGEESGQPVSVAKPAKP